MYNVSSSIESPLVSHCFIEIIVNDRGNVLLHCLFAGVCETNTEDTVKVNEPRISPELKNLSKTAVMIFLEFATSHVVSA